ncbi:hypothetical protein TNCV_4503261 [Trichonephila clavipes]|nr:hypothetical protein TNCV_4503261 [Trichonephila clavipes]
MEASQSPCLLEFVKRQIIFEIGMYIFYDIKEWVGCEYFLFWTCSNDIRWAWRGVLWKWWSEIFVFPPVSVLNMLWSRQQCAFDKEGYLSKGRSVISVQRAFSRLLDIPPRGNVPDWECVSM